MEIYCTKRYRGCKLHGITFQPDYLTISSERQQVITAVAVHILQRREPQVVTAVTLLGLLGEVTVTVVHKETGISIAGVVLRRRESSQDVNIAVLVEIVAMDEVIDGGVLVKHRGDELIGGLVENSGV